MIQLQAKHVEDEEDTERGIGSIGEQDKNNQVNDVVGIAIKGIERCIRFGRNGFGDDVVIKSSQEVHCIKSLVKL